MEKWKDSLLIEGASKEKEVVSDSSRRMGASDVGLTPQGFQFLPGLLLLLQVQTPEVAHHSAVFGSPSKHISLATHHRHAMEPPAKFKTVREREASGPVSRYGMRGWWCWGPRGG
jgi:hypothetical protein